MKSIGYASGIGDDQEQRLMDAGCSKVYRDPSWRPAGAAMQSFGHAARSMRTGDVLAIDKRDRVGRNERESDMLLFVLLKRGIDLVVLDDGVNTKEDGGKFIEELSGKLAAAGVPEAECEALMSTAEEMGEKTLRSKIRPDDYPDIEVRYKRGETSEQIAEAYGVNVTAIRRAKRRIGGNPAVRSPRVGKISPDQYPDLRARFQRKETLKHVSEIYGVSMSVMWKVKKRISGATSSASSKEEDLRGHDAR